MKNKDSVLVAMAINDERLTDEEKKVVIHSVLDKRKKEAVKMLMPVVARGMSSKSGDGE